MPNLCTINQVHCESCGRTDYEEVASRSYSGCCNELVVYSASDCRNHHGRHDADGR